MDFEYIKMLISVVAVPFGFWMLNMNHNLRKDLEEHRLYCARTYLRAEEWNNFKAEIRELFTDFKQDIHKALDNLKE